MESIKEKSSLNIKLKTHPLAHPEEYRKRHEVEMEGVIGEAKKHGKTMHTLHIK